MEQQGEKREKRLYNVMFPIWFMLIMPVTWLVALPINFIVDSVVLWIAMKVMKLEDKKQIYKKSIVKIWLFGFLADIIGALILLTNQLVPSSSTFYQITKAVTWNPFENIIGVLFVAFAVLIAGICIYLFNSKVSFHHVDLEEKKKKRLSLVLAIVTAPYLFFFPTSLLYHQYVGTSDAIATVPMQEITSQVK